MRRREKEREARLIAQELREINRVLNRVQRGYRVLLRAKQQPVEP